MWLIMQNHFIVGITNSEIVLAEIDLKDYLEMEEKMNTF